MTILKITTGTTASRW